MSELGRSRHETTPERENGPRPTVRDEASNKRGDDAVPNLADATDADLLGELVRRGVLHIQKLTMRLQDDHPPVGSLNYYTGWREPVGSVEETP